MNCPHCNKAIGGVEFRCPQCGEVRAEEQFRRIGGDRTAWCAPCRARKARENRVARAAARKESEDHGRESVGRIGVDGNATAD